MVDATEGVHVDDIQPGDASDANEVSDKDLHPDTEVENESIPNSNAGSDAVAEVSKKLMSDGDVQSEVVKAKPSIDADASGDESKEKVMIDGDTLSEAGVPNELEADIKPDTDDDDDDTDDEPEDISLKEGKKLSEENRRKEIESSKTLKELKRQKLKERESRNVMQQEKKRKRKPTSIVPEKLDDDILQFVDNEIEVNTEDIISSNTVERKNKKIIFSDSEDSDKEDEFKESCSEEEGGESQSEELVVKKISAKYIKDVHKEENNGAREFLKNHFFGERVKRDDLKKYMPVKKKTKHSQNSSNVKWLKNRDSRK